MYRIPCSLVVALMLVAAGSVHAEETYSLTVTVKNKAKPEEVQTYKVGNWMYQLKLPVFYGGREMILDCIINKNNQTNEVESVSIALSDLSAIQTRTGEGQTSSGPVTIFSGHFPYEPGKPIVVLDGVDVLTVQVDEGSAKKP